jgi:hypothetical protein
MYDWRFSRRWLWSMVSSRMIDRVVLVRTDVSKEVSDSIIRATRIGEIETTNRRRLRLLVRLKLFLVHRFLSPWWRRREVPPKRRFLQEPRIHHSSLCFMFFRSLTSVKSDAHATPPHIRAGRDIFDFPEIDSEGIISWLVINIQIFCCVVLRCVISENFEPHRGVDYLMKYGGTR